MSTGSKILKLKGFLTKLDIFIKKMVEDYPEQASRLKESERTYIMAKDANPSLICTLFYKHVVEPFEAQIMSKDEKFIKDVAESKLKTDFPEFYDMFEPCLKIWESLPVAEKDLMWKNVQALVVLAIRYTETEAS